MQERVAPLMDKMSDTPNRNDPCLEGVEQYRSYLLLLAQIHLAEQNRRASDASDIVQKSLLEAYIHRDDFRGEPTALLAWLRTILANNIRDAFRFERRLKRNAQREISLDDSLASISQRLGQNLAGNISSPSQQAVRKEELVQLADALLELPLDQQQAVTLHHLQQWPLRDIAEHLNKSEAAIAGLLFRGLRKLRRLINPDSA